MTILQSWSHNCCIGSHECLNLLRLSRLSSSPDVYVEVGLLSSTIHIYIVWAPS